MAQQCSMKGRPLEKNEVLFLLDQIEKREIITSKVRNASCNKLKDAAWNSIAQEFSAAMGEIRRPEQLRLKWENLKKTARKREASTKNSLMLQIPDSKRFHAADDVLDRVISIIGANESNFSMEFGGDKEEEKKQAPMLYPLKVEDPSETPPALSECDLPSESVSDIENEGNFEGRQNYPSSLETRLKPSERVQLAQEEKEKAIAAYFRAKAKAVEFQIELLKLQIEEELFKKAARHERRDK